MPYPVELLTTVADCDAVLAANQKELHELKVSASVLDLRSDKTTDTATSKATELVNLNKTIAALTPLVASLDEGSKPRRMNEAQLRQATHRRENLLANLPEEAGRDAVLQALNLRQIEVQLPEIEQCNAEVTARREALL